MSSPRQAMARPGAPSPTRDQSADLLLVGIGQARPASADVMASSSSGAKRSSRQRERIVGSSRSGEWLTSRKSVLGGGSSRFLSRALAPLRSRSSIASITTARHGDIEAVVANSRCRPRT